MSAKERKYNKQYDKINLFVHEDIRENKQSAAKIAKKKAEDEAEKKLW